MGHLALNKSPMNFIYKLYTSDQIFLNQIAGQKFRIIWHSDLKFVTTVMTGGRVKIFSTVSIFPENKTCI